MNKKSSKEVIEKITSNEIKILVGTQLISKGFHFPYLNCIVVLDIDLSANGHDLRSSEKFTIISSIIWKGRKNRKARYSLFSNL